MPYVVARLFSGSSDQSPEQLDRIARQELVPQLLQIPGLLRYSTLQFNDGRVGAFSVYENREAAERGLRVASEWVSSTEAVRNYRLDETLRGEVVYTVVGQGNQLQRNAYGVARIYETIARAEDIARALQEEAAEIISASTPGRPARRWRVPRERMRSSATVVSRRLHRGGHSRSPASSGRS